MKDEVKKLVYDSGGALIYEGGWWMKKMDYLEVAENPHKWGVDRNERTRQLSIYLMPHPSKTE
jgi:hypothetical protein